MPGLWGWLTGGDTSARDDQLADSLKRLERTELLGRPLAWEWDWKKDRLSFCSERFAGLFGLTVDEAMASFTSELDKFSTVHPDDREGYLEQQRKNPNGAGNQVFEYRILTSNGAVRHVRDIRRTERNADGEIVCQYGSLEDISDAVSNLESLREAELRYRRLYHENPSMFFSVDASGIILSANNYGAAHLGYASEALVGKPYTGLVHETDLALTLENIAKALEAPGQVYQRELRLVRQDGSRCWVRETARAVTDTDGDALLFLLCEDITETRELSEQLSYHASHDALTNLLNRRTFDERLQRVLETVKEEDSEHALCYLDLDQFKVVNDSCGHTAGDELLRQLAELLRINVRKRDTLARLGGDEFGIIMEHCNLQQAKRVAEKLRKEIEEFRFGWGDKVFNVGASIGLVPISNTGVSSTDVLKQADAACYAAKDSGRNRIHVYLEADAELARRHGEMQLVEQIHRALADRRMELYFQDIVRTADAEPTGAFHEILVRMNDEKGQPVAPSAFLAAAERYGLAPRLDVWITEQVIDFLQEHPADLAKMALCSINLSGLSLGSPDFHDFLVEKLDSSGIAADKICFEITETAAITNLTASAEFMRKLRDRGCSFALDDFGSGLSSFAYLKTLPVDYLKIDGLFVRDIASDPVSFTMVKSIHDVGKLMGMQTIAEFVENDAILEKLREIGVDFAQGYGIARPRPIQYMFEEQG